MIPYFNIEQSITLKNSFFILLYIDVVTFISFLISAIFFSSIASGIIVSEFFEFSLFELSNILEIIFLFLFFDVIPFIVGFPFKYFFVPIFFILFLNLFFFIR